MEWVYVIIELWREEGGVLGRNDGRRGIRREKENRGLIFELFSSFLIVICMY